MKPKAFVLLTFVFAMIGSAPSFAAAEPSAAGLWEQSDSAGRVGGWFLIFENGGVYEGALVKIFPKPGDDPNPICKKCKGAQKNQPSLGLLMIKGMKRKGRSYKSGTILDPRDGTVYPVAVEVAPDGQQLSVRGFVGFKLLGRTQVWKRLPDDALPQSELPANLVPILESAEKQSSN